MEFAAMLPRFGDYATPSAIREAAVTVEAQGFDAAWFADHVTFPSEVDVDYPFSSRGESPFESTDNAYDVFQVLAHIAGITDSVALGSNVCIAGYRHPVTLTKHALTLDTLSDGRFEFGIGAGWLEEEFEVLDVPFAERGSRFDELLDIYSRACQEGEFAFEGPHHQFQSTGFYPRPVDDGPPLWIGGWGDKQISRSVKFSDAWVPGVVADLEAVAVRKEKQHEHVAATDRDWEEIDHPLMREAVIGETEAEVLERKEYLPSHLRRRVRGRVLPPTDDRRHCRGLPRPRRGPIRLRNSWPDRRTDRRHARALRTRSPGASLPPLGDAQRAGRRPDPAVRRGGPAPRRVSDYGGRDIVVEAARRPLATVAWCVAGAGTRCH